jgi:hypothetical protein
MVFSIHCDKKKVYYKNNEFESNIMSVSQRESKGF